MSRRFVQSVVVAACVALPILGPVSSAWAEGGKTIATAPAVAFGQQEFGDLNNGGVADNGCNQNPRYREFWLVPVSVGDTVTIDWGVDVADYSSDTYDAQMVVLPVGSNDFNFQQKDPVEDRSPNSVGKDESSFSASQTGNLVLDFTNGDFCQPPFPYDFTVYIKHGVALGLPHIKKVAAGKVVRVGVHHPGGVAIDGPAPTVRLEVEVGSKWRPIGKATTSNGAAVITEAPKRIERGYDIPVRAHSLAGGGYQAAYSDTQYVTVT